MKPCIKCGEIKPLSEFYKHKTAKDGHSNVCKVCRNKQTKAYYEKDIEKWKAFNREKAKQPKYVAKRKAYAKSDAGKKAQKRSQKNQYRKWPFKFVSRVLVYKAIKEGKIQKQPCIECGSEENLHAHHDDYGKPLEIRWLCNKCHNDWHKHNQPIYPNMEVTC